MQRASCSCFVWARSNIIICSGSFVVFIVDNVWNVFWSVAVGGKLAIELNGTVAHKHFRHAVVTFLLLYTQFLQSNNRKAK